MKYFVWWLWGSEHSSTYSSASARIHCFLSKGGCLSSKSVHSASPTRSTTIARERDIQQSVEHPDV